MSQSKEPSTLNELMGKHSTLTMDNLPEVLGDKMPEIPFDRVGRVRLIQSLQQRFGDGFMTIPGVKGILEHFDKEMNAASIIKMNRERK